MAGRCVCPDRCRSTPGGIVQSPCSTRQQLLAAACTDEVASAVRCDRDITKSRISQRPRERIGIKQCVVGVVDPKRNSLLIDTAVCRTL